MILEDFGSTMLACTPSYALVIADTAAEMGVDPPISPVGDGVFGAEPWTDEWPGRSRRARGFGQPISWGAER